jgi:hypothetical protein
MQKLVLTSGKTVPVKNVTRWQNKEMIEISISNSELIANNLEFSEVLNLLKDHVETVEMKLINDAEGSRYVSYSKNNNLKLAYPPESLSVPFSKRTVIEFLLIVRISTPP